jgi:hypothetical protein
MPWAAQSSAIWSNGVPELPARAQVEMRVEVDDGQAAAPALLLPVLAQTLVGAESNLMAAAQHDRMRARIEQFADGFTEFGLGTLQITVIAIHITCVGEHREAMRGHVGQRAADLARALCGTSTTVVAHYACIAGKAQ